MNDNLDIDNGASTGTLVRSVHPRMITLRDVGKIDGTVASLFKLNTEGSWAEAGDEMRSFDKWWTSIEGDQFKFLYLFLYLDATDPGKGIKPLGADPLQHDAIKYVWEGCIGSAAAKLEAKAAMSMVTSQMSVASVAAPPRSGIAKSLEARKAPPFASYSDKTEDSKWSFIRALAPSLSSPLVSVEEGRALLGTLMSERGTSFLTSHGCLTATTAVGLLGALMMEVERVDSVAQLRSRVFCADQRRDETLLEFIDRVSDRHQIFCIAYPKALRDDEALLNRVIQVMDFPEYGVQMIMRSAANLAEAREVVRTLNLPSLHEKPSKPRGVYAVDLVDKVPSPPVPPPGIKNETDGVRADVDAIKEQVMEIMRMVATQSKTIGQMRMGGGKVHSDLCYECNEPGHIGRDCEKRKARHVQEKLDRETKKLAIAPTAVNPDFV